MIGSRALVLAYPECSVFVGKQIKSYGLGGEGVENLEIKGIECLLTSSYLSLVYSFPSQ